MSHKSRKDKQQHATPAPGKQAVPGAAPGWHFADKARSEQEQLASVMQWVLDTLPMAVWWKNRDSVWQGGNIYFARETGVESPRQLVGRRDHEFFPKEHADFFVKCDLEVMKSGQPHYNIIEPQLKTDGRLHWLQTNKAPLRDAQGNIIGTLGTYEDITDRIEAQQRLSAQLAVVRIFSEANSVSEALSRIIETLLSELSWQCGSVWLLDEKAQLMRCAGTAKLPGCDVGGYEISRNALELVRGQGPVGKAWQTVVPVWVQNSEPGVEKTLPDPFADTPLNTLLAFPIAIAGEVFGVIELMHIHNLAADQPLLAMLSSLGSQIGQFIERQHVHEQLLQTAQQMVRSTTPGAIYQLRQDAGKTYLVNASDGIRYLVGYTASEIENNAESLLQRISTEDIEQLKRTMAESARTMQAWTRELKVLSKDDRQKWIRTTCTPRLSADGSIVWNGIALDITDIKEAEILLAERAEELADTNARLRETERLKDEFVANVSHELRTPLTLLLSPLESMLAGDFGPVAEIQQPVLRTMHNNAVRLLQMITGLLDFSKLSAGKLDFNPEPTEVVGLTRSILSDFQPLFEQKEIINSFQASVEICWIQLDRYLYERIVFNLLSNAVKFTPQGGKVTVALDLSNSNLDLTVSDTGIGIAKQEKEHIFERFRQLEGASSRRFEGSGLGLALVKEFAGILGGTVCLESELAKGSKFLVSLKANHCKPAALDTIRPSAKRLPVSMYQEKAVDLKVLPGSELPKILLAEDNVEMAAYIAGLLHDIYQVKLAYDGEEALSFVKQWSPDLVIADVMMPKCDGFSLCRQIKAAEETRTLPVILLTALIQREALLKGFECGADDYLLKPFHPKVLLARVNSILSSVSARKMYEKKLVEACQRAVEATQVKSQFLATMSHEIRTPLNVMIGMLDLFLYSQLTASQRVQATIALDAAKSLLELIGNILDFSKIEAGRLDLEEADVDLVQLVEGTAELMANQAHQKGLALSTFVAQDVPRAVLGDPGRLRQILLNLVSNGIKFTDHGEVTIKVGVDPAGTKGLFTVSDTGIGISPAAQERLFEPFLQADGSITRRYGGTGLGLSISKKLVELMSGDISVRSVETQGTDFLVSVPLKPCLHELEKFQPPALLHNARVLIVDGPEQSSKALFSYMTDWGMDVQFCETGKSALSLMSHCAQSGKPLHLVFMDRLLPDMEAFVLANEIKARTYLARTPLILLTSVAIKDDRSSLPATNFSAVLLRPINQSHLLDCLVTLLSAELEKSRPEYGLELDKPTARKNVQILVAEDNLANQKLIQLQLQRLGYASHCVSNGYEVVDAASRFLYELILMDVMMPEMNGLEATRTIRQREMTTGNRIPIIAMTAQAMVGDREKCLDVGMDDYLAKPVDLKSLSSILERWMPESD